MDPDRAAAIVAEEMPCDPDPDRLRARIAAEMRARGLSPPECSRTAESPGRVLAAWDRAWDRIKAELAPRVRVRVRKAPPKYPWITADVQRARR